MERKERSAEYVHLRFSGRYDDLEYLTIFEAIKKEIMSFYEKTKNDAFTVVFRVDPMVLYNDILEVLIFNGFVNDLTNFMKDIPSNAVSRLYIHCDMPSIVDNEIHELLMDLRKIVN